MKGVVKLEAMRTLGAFIESQVMELKGKVTIHQVPPDIKAGFPSVAIVAGGRYRYDPRQEGVFSLPNSSSVVVNVGSWHTTVQVRLACATPAERYTIQDKLEALFWREEDRPGVLLTTVTACPQLGDILAAWDIGDTDWDDEAAFSSQYWSVLTVDAAIPALVIRGGVYTIDDLRFGLTSDFSTPSTSAAFDRLPRVVRINADGTITPI